jgi:transposase-like protein
MAKLNQTAINTILDSNYSVSHLAKRFGVSKQHIYNIRIRAKRLGTKAPIIEAPLVTKSPVELENEMLWGVIRKLARAGKISLRLD